MMYHSRLRDLRKESGLTQQRLVGLLHMHKTTYTNYEQGKRDLPLTIAIQLASFYNVSLDYLVGRSAERSVASSPPIAVPAEAAGEAVALGK